MSDSGPRIHITGGGAPDDAEHAAILAAVTEVLGSREQRRDTPRSAWSLAGRREGVGMNTVRARSELPRE